MHVIGDIGGGAAGRQIGVVAHDDAHAFGRHAAVVQVLFLQARHGHLIDANPCEGIGMPLTAQRIGIDDSHQFSHSAYAVAHHECGLAARGCHQFVANDQQAVITAGQVAFDHDVFAKTQGDGVGSFELSAGFHINRHTFALVTVLRLNHHRQTNFLRHSPSIIHIFHRAAFRHGQTSHSKELFRQLFVLRNGFSDGAAGIGFGGLNAPLLAAPTELHQATLGQANKRNMPIQTSVHDRCG